MKKPNNKVASICKITAPFAGLFILSGGANLFEGYIALFVSLTLGFIIGLFLYAVGEIIELLTEVNFIARSVDTAENDELKNMIDNRTA